MNNKRSIIFLFTFCLLQLVAFGQSPKIGFAGAVVIPAEELKPAPDDSFSIDPVTGDIVIQYKDGNGKVVSYIFDRGMQIRPEISVQYSMSGTGLIKYRFTIQNAESAKKEIALLAIPWDGKMSIINEVKPSGWISYDNRVFNWYSWNYIAGQKVVGNSSFEFETSMLPGVINPDYS